MENDRKICLDFYYGNEAEQYNFYRIPKLLFTDKRFENVSIEAKVLYGLLLDRMSLSIKNKWLDEENRVYIYFKVSDAMEFMNICKDKCIKLFAELDSDKGCGLIVRKRQGLGKPSIIYVMNFNSGVCENNNELDEAESLGFQRSEKQTSGGMESIDFKKSENQTSDGLEISTSESMDIRLQEVEGTDTNKNKINNNKINNTDFNNINPIISHQHRETTKNSNVIDEIREREKYKELICENIEYETLVKNYGESDAYGIVNIMLDAICSKKDYLTIKSEQIPQMVVKTALLKLDYSHIEYVLECMNKNRTKVHNIDSYLLTSLYNSLSTIGHYYRAEANHDI